MKKKISILFAIILSSSIQAQSYNRGQVNEFECSPSEMASILTKESPSRVTQTSYSDFTKPYQQAMLQEIVNEKNAEDPQANYSVEDLTKEDLEDAGQDSLACLDVDFSKIGENIMAGVDALSSLLTDGIQEAGDLIDDTMEDLSKGLCSRFVTGAANWLLEQGAVIGEEAKRELENEIRRDEYLRILDNGGRELFINDQIRETFGDKSRMLRWRDGEVDKDNFKNQVDSMWGRELDDLYRDFDDQVDDEIRGSGN